MIILLSLKFSLKKSLDGDQEIYNSLYCIQVEMTDSMGDEYLTNNLMQMKLMLRLFTKNFICDVILTQKFRLLSAIISMFDIVDVVLVDIES